jgi:hypothetical protein
MDGCLGIFRALPRLRISTNHQTDVLPVLA